MGDLRAKGRPSRLHSLGSQGCPGEGAGAAPLPSSPRLVSSLSVLNECSSTVLEPCASAQSLSSNYLLVFLEPLHGPHHPLPKFCP